MFLPVPGLYACLFIPRCSGHTITANRFPGKFTLYKNLLKYINLEISLEENLNILPCNSHRGQKFYYSGVGIT